MSNDTPNLSRTHLAALLWTSFATFTALYGLQPLLPLFAEHFAVTSQAASLIMTFGILPLAIAPVCYGYLLNMCTTRTLLLASVAVCAAGLCAQTLAVSFSVFLGLRALSCLLMPAIVLGVMTHIALFCPPNALQRTMTVYTTVAMIGGYGGRIGSGLVADAFGLHAVLALHTVLLLTTLPCLWGLARSATLRQGVFAPSHLIRVFRQPGLMALMLTGPLCIFAHAAVLNLAPFRMRELFPDAGGISMGLLYVPAFVCSLLGVFSKRVLNLLHGELATIRTGIALFLVSVFFIIIPDSSLALTACIFCTTAGFVLVYTTLPGVVNRASKAQKNMTNSVYLTMYYALSALGTWLPILLYSHHGIEVYVASLLAASGLALALTRHSAHLVPDKG